MSQSTYLSNQYFSRSGRYYELVWYLMLYANFNVFVAMNLKKKLFKRCLVLLLFAWFVSQGTQNDQQYSNPFHLPEKNNQGLSRNVPEITQFLSHKKVNQM